MSRIRKVKKAAKASPGMTPKWDRLVTQMAIRIGRRLSLGITEDQQEAMERQDLRVKSGPRKNRRR